MLEDLVKFIKSIRLEEGIVLVAFSAVMIYGLAHLRELVGLFISLADKQ